MRIITLRQVDELGRIVLPLELRTQLGITAKTALEISADNKKIILYKKDQTKQLG